MTTMTMTYSYYDIMYILAPISLEHQTGNIYLIQSSKTQHKYEHMGPCNSIWVGFRSEAAGRICYIADGTRTTQHFYFSIPCRVPTPTSKRFQTFYIRTETEYIKGMCKSCLAFLLPCISHC